MRAECVECIPMAKLPELQWTDRELGTLGRDLQDMTLHGLAVRGFIRARIAYAK
mgnify:CR=1 FL=1